MGNKLIAVAILTAPGVWAGVLPKIDLPKDSPVAVLSSDYGDSNESVRGGASMLDLHAALTLRNSSQRRIRGVTMVVTAQDRTPGGKGSVTVTSLDVGPGETFPLRIDLRLMRPVQAGMAPVLVGLDGVLFDDLGFYGPDRLNSRRSMTVSEVEARRDRQYFKALLASGGQDKLQTEMLTSMARQSERPNPDVRMVRAGRSTNFEPEKQMQFAFLNLPDSPVQPMEGVAQIAGNEASAPRMLVRNRGEREIRYLEIGWILKDGRGQEFLAGSVSSPVSLRPGQTGPVVSESSLRFPSRPGQPLSIESMSGFVSSVEYADGGVWVPNRADLADGRLRRILGPSAEEQRLAQLYSRKGLKALVDELKKF